MLLNIKCVFWFSLQISPEKFLIQRRLQQDITINVHRHSCKAPIIHFRFSPFSSSVGPAANATYALQPRRLIVLTLTPPTCLDIPTFAARCLHVHDDTRDPSSERGNCVVKNWPVILPEIATSTSIRGAFTCRKSATRDRRPYFPSEGRRAEEFFALKNPDGFGWVWTRELGYLKAARYP